MSRPIGTNNMQRSWPFGVLKTSMSTKCSILNISARDSLLNLLVFLAFGQSLQYVHQLSVLFQLRLENSPSSRTERTYLCCRLSNACQLLFEKHIVTHSNGYLKIDRLIPLTRGSKTYDPPPLCSGPPHNTF